MKIKFILLVFCLGICNIAVNSQNVPKNEMEQKADAELARGNRASARSLYNRAFEQYAAKGELQRGVVCGINVTSLYHKENLYKEAFEYLHHVEQLIASQRSADGKTKASMYYQVSRERFRMYMKLRKSDRIQEQLNSMERWSANSGQDSIQNDMLYNKAIYYYTYGKTEEGNATFKKMAANMTNSDDYKKVSEVYLALIASGKKSNNAHLVAQSYNSYIAWKDSVEAVRVAAQIDSLEQQIANNEAEISDKDSSLSASNAFNYVLIVLVVALVAVLVFGSLVLMRFIALTRKQKSTIKMLNENNALQAKFIGNIFAQINPSLQKLDESIPDVKALKEFTSDIRLLSQLECSTDESLTMEETQITSFCENAIDQIRDKVRRDVSLMVNTPKMSVNLNKEYVMHILSHLLNNAAIYTPEGGVITIDFKKRSVHKYQFMISNTGNHIPEEQHEDIFKPFLTIRDLTQGDGMGLPICKQMALKMKGDLTIDPEYTKGTRFVLTVFD